MARWRRNKRVAVLPTCEEPEQMLGTGDRSVIVATESADDLARQLLEIARDKAKDLPPGSQVTISMTKQHLEVHHLELFTSLMILSHEYGLRVDVQFNNEQTFMKI